MISDLPCELETEILSRVPPKSLAKLQTTCKRWYVLFKDPTFVKKNSDKAAKEVILRTDYFRIHSINLTFQGVHKLMKSTGKLRRQKDLKELIISGIYHCDGLVLCSTEESKSRLVVWNPCTGETKNIKPRNCYMDGIRDLYGFGYGKSESSSRSYKILRSTRFFDKDSKGFYCEMYEFSSDSWRVLPRDHTNKYWGGLSEATLKGNTYYIATDREGGGHCIIRFDFTTERFVSFTLPPESGPQHRASLSVVREEELAVLLYDFSVFPRYMKVWLSNKIDDAKEVSWTKFLVEDVNIFGIPRYFEGLSFMVDEKNKVVVCCSRGMALAGDGHIYDVGEDFLRQVYKERICFTWSRPRLHIYAPSLARIPKSKEEEKRGG